MLVRTHSVSFLMPLPIQWMELGGWWSIVYYMSVCYLLVAVLFASDEIDCIRFYVPLDTKLIILETFFPVSLLAWYWRFFHWVYQLQLWLITSVQSNLAKAASPSHTHLCNVYSFTVGTCHVLCLDNRKSRYHVMLQNRSLWHIDCQLSWIFEINLLTVVALARPIPHHLAKYSGHRWR